VDAVNKLIKIPISMKTQLSPNVDLIKGNITGIKTVKMNNGTILVNHIIGHHDKKNKAVDGIADLNIQADSGATKGLQQSTIKDVNLPSENALLMMDGQKNMLST
jgi:hypothetical protein